MIQDPVRKKVPGTPSALSVARIEDRPASFPPPSKVRAMTLLVVGSRVTSTPVSEAGGHPAGMLVRVAVADVDDVVPPVGRGEVPVGRTEVDPPVVRVVVAEGVRDVLAGVAVDVGDGVGETHAVLARVDAGVMTLIDVDGCADDAVVPAAVLAAVLAGVLAGGDAVSWPQAATTMDRAIPMARRGAREVMHRVCAPVMDAGQG